jgi:hypothetical protein
MNKENIKKVISTSLTTPAYSTHSVKTMKPELTDDSNNNYLDNGTIGRILRWPPHYQPVIHWVTIAIFLIIIYSGLTNGNAQKFVEGSVFATAFVWDIWHPLLAFFMAIIILTVLSIAAVISIYLLQRIHEPKNAKQRLVTYSYAFIPLGLATYMAWNVFRLFRGLFYGIYDLTQWAGLQVFNGNPSLNFETLNLLQILLLLSGLMLSIWLGYRLTTGESKSKTLNNGLLSMVVVMGVYTIAGLWILALPVLG